VSFERGFDADPLRSYLDSLRLIADLRPALVYPGHGRPFGDAAGRIEAILRNKLRRLETIRRAIRERPRPSPSSPTAWSPRRAGPPAPAGDLRDLAHIAYLRWSGCRGAPDAAGRGLRVVLPPATGALEVASCSSRS
jgi:glyoxylase-like metal-dependent hydrolase (beta-lactamase superfamily II)